MFREWDSFILLVGSGAGALIGLLFVVVTLTAGADRSLITRGQKIYMSPTVFHLAAIVVVTAIESVPEVADDVVGVLVMAMGLIGFAYSLSIVVRIARGPELNAPTHWTDVWFYGAAPAAAYAVLAASGAAVWVDRPAAPYAIAFSLTALLLIVIRNAWDLVTWLAPRTEELKHPSGSDG